MRKLSRSLLAASVAAVVSIGLGACGSDDDDSGGGGGGGETGGEITAAFTSSPQFTDPATEYTAEGWTALWTVYLGPVTYRHAEDASGSELIAGLAEEMPAISDDGKTYTWTFRKGLKFSDGTPLKASDWEHTIKRVLTLESGGMSYYEGIVGVDKYLESGDPDGDISGIKTDDATGKVTVTLVEPDGAFLHVLAMLFSGVVPGDTPFKNQSKNPPPGIGQFKITSSVPNRELVLEKNDNYPEIADAPPAKLDKITIKIVKDERRQAQDVIRGDLDWIVDPPPADLLPEIREKYADRFETVGSPSTYFLYLNEEVEPFDDPKVREAVATGLDKEALARLFGGLLTPGCNFLPPELEGVGYKKLDPCPYGDPEIGGGDLETAKQMIEDAGAAGAEVTVWGNDEDPTQKVTENLADQLTQMGFKAEPKVVAGTVWLQTIGNKKTPNNQAGFDNWFQDFPHPANWFFLVHGDTIQPTNNTNHSNTNVPEFNREIDALAREPDLAAVADRYAELDRKVVEHAGDIPYGYRKLVNFMSERMDFENCSTAHPVYSHDLTGFCLKP
jgi:peptide/nickel transport system substrate-binding protein